VPEKETHREEQKLESEKKGDKLTPREWVSGFLKRESPQEGASDPRGVCSFRRFKREKWFFLGNPIN